MAIDGLGMNGINRFYNMTNKETDTSQIALDKVKAELDSISDESSDEELMNACKSFESYMLNSVYKQMRESVKSINKDDEDDNEYMKIFGDNLYEEYSNMAVQNSSLGIAQILFDSIKKGK